jgi:hypothetical protein
VTTQPEANRKPTGSPDPTGNIIDVVLLPTGSTPEANTQSADIAAQGVRAAPTERDLRPLPAPVKSTPSPTTPASNADEEAAFLSDSTLHTAQVEVFPPGSVVYRDNAQPLPRKVFAMSTTPDSDQSAELGTITFSDGHRLSLYDVAEIQAYAKLVAADPELAPVSVLFPEWRDDVDPEAA